MPNIQPIARGFNVAVQHIAGRLFPCGFDASPDAPDTFDGLAEHVKATGRMVVFNGACDHTSFADVETNLAFRAWHDWCHLSGGFDFTPAGEAGAARMQREHLRTLFGVVPLWERLLEIEVNGQVAHFETTGEFPVDQHAFALARLGVAS